MATERIPSPFICEQGKLFPDYFFGFTRHRLKIGVSCLPEAKRKHIGEVAEVQAPTGILKFRVEDITV